MDVLAGNAHWRSVDLAGPLHLLLDRVVPYSWQVEHRRPSSVSSEVSKHIHIDNPTHGVQLANTEALEVEPRWFERRVKEAIYIRALRPSLNRDGGRYYLPAI